jgi:predicted esterase
VLAGLGIAAFVSLAACSRSHEPALAVSTAPSIAPAVTSDAGTDASDASDASTGLRPLTEAEWLEHFKLEGGDEASVTVPLGATTPRPILVAVHGAGDRPEWACGGWRMIVDAYAFVVCPQGVPIGGGKFAWSSADQIARIVDKALPALRRRFGVFVADGPLVYAGFSQGARLGVLHTGARANDYEAVALVEGAYEDVDAIFASKLAKAGERRVLLACSTGNCDARFRPAKAALTRANVDVRVRDAGNHGHNLNGEVVDAMKEPFSWLVKDDPRWAGLPALTKEPPR